MVHPANRGWAVAHHLGFMVAAAFLSMWISNTATAIMMVPIAMAIILQLEERIGRSPCHSITAALILGIAYASSPRGMGWRLL